MLKYRYFFTCVALGIIGSLLCLPATAVIDPNEDPHEPNPDPASRGLRSDYVKTWHIFNDDNTNGILDPGDTRLDQFENWWTPVSASSQWNYDPGSNGDGTGTGNAAGPMNWANHTVLVDGDPTNDSNFDNPFYNFWLPRDKNTMNFYMTYSQFDNNDWTTFKYGASGVSADAVAERNMFRNGYGLGWVTHDFDKNPDGSYVSSRDQTLEGQVEMDIFVHDGERTESLQNFGTSRSNPQLALVTDIDPLAFDGDEMRPPAFQESSQSYDISEPDNNRRFTGQPQLDTVVASMERKETDPFNLGDAAVDPNIQRTPDWIKDNLTEHDGTTPYEYQDAFQERSDYVQGCTTGGVIAGLSGHSGIDPERNWGDQQVIRIDISPETLMEGDPEIDGGITTIAFYDFGVTIPGSDHLPDDAIPDQVHPRGIFFGADAGGNLYYTGDGTQWIPMPENRIYIAVVDVVPEPTTIAMISVGAVGLVMRRRRR